MPGRTAARTPEPPSDELRSLRPTPRTSPLRTALSVLAGLILLGLLLYHVGLEPVHDCLDAVGWRGPFLLLPYAVIAWLDTRAWRCTLPETMRHRISTRALYLARMAGEAVNSLAPTAAVGEPLKVYLLRPWGLTGSDGFASIVIAKTALTVSQSFFVVLGLAALSDRLDKGMVGALLIALFLLGAAGFTIGLVWLQRRGPAASVWRLARRIAPRAAFVARLEMRATAIDRRLAEFYHVERDAFLRGAVWNMSGWLLGVGEVWLMALLIRAPIGFYDALIIEALAQPIRAIAILIPGGLGAQEVGGVALCTFLGMSEPAAVTLWLLKRGRELVFDSVGLVYLARHTARGKSAAGPP